MKILQQLYIIATVCLLIVRTPIIRWAKFHYFKGQAGWRTKRLKPFDCPLCLTWWVSLFVNGYSLPLPEAIGIAAVSALVASELERYLNR